MSKNFCSRGRHLQYMKKNYRNSVRSFFHEVYAESLANRQINLRYCRILKSYFDTIGNNRELRTLNLSIHRIVFSTRCIKTVCCRYFQDTDIIRLYLYPGDVNHHARTLHHSHELRQKAEKESLKAVNKILGRISQT